MLPEYGDPEALEWRVAYRLASMAYSADLVRHLLLCSRSAARDLRLGRVPLTVRDAQTIAAAIGMAPHVLMAPLTDAEFNTFAFNSASTRRRLTVWSAARTCWHEADWSWHQAASVLGMSPGWLYRAFSDGATRRLLVPRAATLATALNLCPGARTFIKDVPHHWRAECCPKSREP